MVTSPSISCNDGCPVAITSNCRDALLSLRDLAGNEQLTIWVDSICINQQDDKEKEVQLPLMGNIYTFAETTYVWLGIGNDGMHSAMKYFRQASALSGLWSTPGYPWLRGSKRLLVHDDKRGLWWQWFRWEYFYRFRLSLGKRKRAEQMNLSPTQSDAMASLLDVSWFQRAWTFQEVILASNPVIVCGSEALDWSAWQRGLFSFAIGCYNNGHLSEVLRPWMWKAHFRSWSKNHGVPYLEEVPSNATNLWPKLVPWLRLCQLWDKARRPTRWNDKELRNISKPTGGDAWTAQSYRQEPTFSREVFKWTLVLVELAVFLILIALLTLGMFFIQNDIVRVSSLLWGGLLFFFFFILWSGRFYHTKVIPSDPGIPEVGVFEVADIDLSRTLNQTKKGGSVYLVGVLEALRERRASIAHDKAFALHSVMQNMGITPPQPDYSKSVGEVYHQLTLTLLEWQPSMIVLLLDAGTQFGGVPSWVPDWSAVPERSWLPKAWIYGPAAADDSNNSPEPQDHELPAPGAKVSLCKLELTLRGTVVGPVTASFGPMEVIDIHASRLETMEVDTAPSLWRTMLLISQWIDGTRLSLPLEGPYHSISYAIFTILSGGIETGLSRDLGTFKVWYKFMLESQRLARLKTQEDSKAMALAAHSHSYTPETLAEFLCPRLLSNPEALKYAISCGNELAGKRGLFYSLHGCSGTGPPAAAPGDNIVVFDGLPVPMITRSDAEGRQTVIGPAYVPGLTHMREAKDNQYKWKDITLV